MTETSIYDTAGWMKRALSAELLTQVPVPR